MTGGFNPATVGATPATVGQQLAEKWALTRERVEREKAEPMYPSDEEIYAMMAEDPDCGPFMDAAFPEKAAPPTQ